MNPPVITEFTFVDRAGRSVVVRAEIDMDKKLERAVRMLAMKARDSKTQKCASMAYGAIRVCITSDSAPRVAHKAASRCTCADGQCDRHELGV